MLPSYNRNKFHYDKVILSTRALSLQTEITYGPSRRLDGGRDVTRPYKYFSQCITEVVIFAGRLPLTRINERIYSRNRVIDRDKRKLKGLMLKYSL